MVFCRESAPELLHPSLIIQGDKEHYDGLQQHLAGWTNKNNCMWE